MLSTMLVLNGGFMNQGIDTLPAQWKILDFLPELELEFLLFAKGNFCLGLGHM